MNLLNLGDGLFTVNSDGSAQFVSGLFGISSEGDLTGSHWGIRNDGSASFGNDGLSIGTDGRIQALQANFCNFGADNSFRINDDGYPRVGNPAVEDFVGIDRDIQIASVTIKVRRGLIVGVDGPHQ